MARFNIVNGPGKWDFSIALFDGNSRNRRGFEFSIFDPSDRKAHERVCVINKVERADGTGDSWLFEGYYAGANHPAINGSYSTKTRKGWIEIPGE